MTVMLTFIFLYGQRPRPQGAEETTMHRPQGRSI